MDTGATVTQIGKYPILGVLGVGGMGVVYRGMDKSVGREVAIKTLTAATDELRQRFLLEARSGILNHPNIVTVYDSASRTAFPTSSWNSSAAIRWRICSRPAASSP